MYKTTIDSSMNDSYINVLNIYVIKKTTKKYKELQMNVVKKAIIIIDKLYVIC